MNSQAETMEKPSSRVWGPWATAGIGIIIFAVYIASSVIVVASFAAMELSADTDANIDTLASQIKNNGNALAVATCLTTIVCVPITILAAMLRRGAPVRHYLALHAVEPRMLLRWLGIAVVFMLVSDAITVLLGRSVVPEFIAKVYESAHGGPLFWIALVVGAPIFEETFFRGFLFEGFQHSRMGPVGTILVTAVLWTVIHVQYDLYELSTILVLGILLGFARLHSRSIFTTVAMHALINLGATLEAAWYFSRASSGAV